jgi:polyisoprenoid-binding protein YceI
MKKIALISTLFFFVFALQAQEKQKIDSYKVAFFSKDATGVFKEMSGTVVSKISDILADIQAIESKKNELDLSFNLKIMVGSINTGNGVQNKHAKSSEWFHAEQYPTIDFVSSSVYKTDKGVFAKGKLSIHGVTKEVTIPIEITNKDTKIIYKAEFSVNRMNYRLGPDSKVSRNIKIIAGISVLK